MNIVVRFLKGGWFYVRSITKKVFEDDIFFLASGIAFNGILTMIPLMLLLASAVGSFLNSSALGVQQLNDILNTIFPPQPFATNIKDSILTIISRIVIYRRSLGFVGFGVLIWSATSLFDALRSVLHIIYRLDRTRNFFVSLVHDVGFVVLAFVLFIVSNLAIWVFTLIENVVLMIPALKPLNLPRFNEGIPTAIVIILTTFMFYIIYRYVTDSKPPRAAAVISTITTTVLWVASGKLFGIYLSDFSGIGKIYGPYAFLLVLLFWIYYSSIIFVFGGIVGQVHWERVKSKKPRNPKSPS